MTTLSIRAALMLSLVAGFVFTSWVLPPSGMASEAIDLTQLREMWLPIP